MLKLIDISVGLTFISLMLFAVVPASSEMTDEQYYNQYVDKYIEKCAWKDKNRSGSCFPSIKQSGALNCLKASYVYYFKRPLVQQLLMNGIERKDYKIDKFINANFYVVFRAAAEDIRDQYNDAIEDLQEQ